MTVAPAGRGDLVLVAVEDRGDGGRVARVTVNNPERRNALGNAGKRALAEAIETVSADPTLRVVVLTGAGANSQPGPSDCQRISASWRSSPPL